MKKILFLALFAIGIAVSAYAVTKLESGSITAQSYVLYGITSEGTLVPFLVSTEGTIQSK
jgi:hypothetical protein